ncbi:hypothetical protein HF086_008279 [Spodoptera exigua]|uniref:Dolichyl-diphosphooligosaccharide--protein glycosyltransferase subunit STT3A n=1 Tax=Spodoptera exigua TaxID=7107 RepID=A0A922SE90_SPOEX|nr:hypothetical protein HF086_008279 [Spodoptera exigua]
MTVEVQTKAKLPQLSSDKQLTFIKLAVLSMAAILCTIYPGLMVTSATLYNMMQFLNITIDIRNVCDEGAGLVAAAMIAIVPGYISRSVAGSYDNEGIAIFCMLLTYYFWIKAVSSWGGYVFLINLIPLHVLALMLLGRFSARVYVAYSTLYCVGTILSMQISFVGFQPVQSSEHMLALGTFGLCQLYAFTQYLREHLSPANFELLFKALVTTLLATLGTALVALTLTGKISPWTGRFYSLLDPSYAKNHIPIIASVSEHQPTSWSSFYFDLQVLVFLFPAGLYFCFSKLTDANIFIILYGVLSIYFAGVMVRLMLVLAPVMCIVSGVAASSLLSLHVKDIEPKVEKHDKKKKHENNLVFRSEISTSSSGWSVSAAVRTVARISARQTTTRLLESSGSTRMDHRLYSTASCRPPGFDRVRGAEIGNKDFNLDVLEEAYTTEHWLVRIYKVKPLPNRGV